MRRNLYAAVIIAGLSAIVEAQSPTDWTQWRGPARDGVIASFTPPPTWPDALVKRWNVEIGTGYATPIVVGDRVYQFSRIGENETMTAFDAANGTQLWQGGYPAAFTVMSAAAAHGPGSKSTPIFFDNRLYSIGMTGTVTAWDAVSGRQLWQKPGDPKNVPLYTTHSFSPIVERGTVIFHLGGDSNGAISEGWWCLLSCGGSEGAGSRRGDITHAIVSFLATPNSSQSIAFADRGIRYLL